MAAPKTMSGARAKLAVVDPNTGQARVVGIFNNVSYGLTYDVQPVYILGRFSPAELDYTGQEPVSITCSGWRVIGHGPHVSASVPKLQDLLTADYLELTVIDRQSEINDPGNAQVAKFHSCRATGYSTSITARQLEEVTVNFVGLLVDDESTVNAEHSSAASLP